MGWGFYVQVYSQREIINHMDGGNAVVQQKDGIWYIDENSGVADDTIFLRGSYERLRKGSYTVAVEYESDWNHSMEIYAEGEHVNADKSIALSRGKNVQKTSIRVTQNIDDFEVRLYYSGKGYIRIDSIVVIRNNEEQRERLLLIAIITAIFGAYFLWLKGYKRYIKVCPILAGMLTGIAISVNGQINEGSSFISTLQRECNGIGIDKLVVSIALIYFYKKQWYLIYEIKSFVIGGLAAVFSVFMIIGISFVAFFMVVYIDCCIKAGNKQPLRIKDFMILFFSSLLVCITRKNGIYLVLPQCLCLVVWIREKREVFGILLLCISFFGIVYYGCSFARTFGSCKRFGKGNVIYSFSTNSKISFICVRGYNRRRESCGRCYTAD